MLLLLEKVVTYKPRNYYFIVYHVYSKVTTKCDNINIVSFFCKVYFRKSGKELTKQARQRATGAPDDAEADA